MDRLARHRERKKKAREGAHVDVSVDPASPTPELASRLLESSALKSRVAAESLAADCVRLENALVGLEVKRAAGPLTEDEYKALAALTSNKRRLFETLGVVAVAEEDDGL